MVLDQPKEMRNLGCRKELYDLNAKQVDCKSSQLILAQPICPNQVPSEMLSLGNLHCFTMQSNSLQFAQSLVRYSPSSISNGTFFILFE